jgi:hypothetical protein
MQKLKLILVFLFSALLIGQAFAMDEDLKNCRYKTGIKIPADECEVFQRMERKKDEAAERARTQAEQSRAESAAWQKERDDKAAQDKVAYQARQRQEESELAERKRAYQAERDADDRSNELADRKAQARAATLKSACGADYLTPKIGMPIDRALQCTGKYRITAQLNRADGVITTYSGPSGYIHAMSGRVVSWGR